jgi:Tfp pilus assembly protein PilN
MIQINLLPEELRQRGKSTFAPQDYVWYIAGGLLGVLFFLHILLGFIFLVRGIQLSAELSAWKKQESLFKKVESFKQDYGYLFQDENLAGPDGPVISWSEKLFRISENLPSGIWLDELSCVEKNFQLRGSIISLQKNEIGLMNMFIDALKKDRIFFKDFMSLEAGPLKRRTIVSYEVVDFSLQGVLRR